MSHHFIVSDPPHRSDLDAHAVCDAFGLTPGEVRMKAQYMAPELWFVEQEKLAAVAKARALKQAGLNVLVAKSSDIAQIPGGDYVNGFRFEDSGMTWRAGAFDKKLEDDKALTVVMCKPLIVGNEYKKFKEREKLKAAKQQKGKKNKFGIDGEFSYDALATGSFRRPEIAMGDPNLIQQVLNEQYANAFLDIYQTAGEGIIRLTAPVSEIDFSCLGSRQQSNVKENLDELLNMLSDCFGQCGIDQRLVGVPYREPMLGSKRFGQIVDEVAPELSGVDIFDFASRFCFLSHYVKARMQDTTQVLRMPRGTESA